MTWSGVYPRSTLSKYLLQKELILAPLTETGPEVYVDTMTAVLSNSYNSLKETVNHLKSIKLEYMLGGF